MFRVVARQVSHFFFFRNVLVVGVIFNEQMSSPMQSKKKEQAHLVQNSTRNRLYHSKESSEDKEAGEPCRGRAMPDN